MQALFTKTGEIVLCDDADFALLSRYQWSAHRQKHTIYARTSQNRSSLYIHRLLLGAEAEGRFVDHINGNGLDNRRENLRVVNNRQNQMNRKPVRRDGLKGIAFNKKAKRWQAAIRINDRNVHLGLFDDKYSAARAYASAAHKHFGEFARVSVGMGSPSS